MRLWNSDHTPTRLGAGALVLALVLFLIAFKAATAPAAGPPVRPAAQTRCVAFSCEIYFTAEETRQIADAGTAAAVATVACTQVKLPYLAIGCAAASGYWIAGAIYARNQHDAQGNPKCFKLIFTPYTLVGTPSSYTCGRVPVGQIERRLYELIGAHIMEQANRGVPGGYGAR